MSIGRSIHILLITAIALVWIPQVVSAADFIDIFRQGLDAEDAGNLDQALNLFSEAIKTHQNSAQAWAKRAEIQLKKGDPQSAIKDLLQAVKLDPGYAASYIRLGFAHNAINQYDRAIEALDVAVKLDPNSGEALNTRGFAYNGKNDYDRAITDFDRAIRLNANDSRYYNNRGFARNGKHDYAKAIEDFDRAIQLDATNAMYYNNRGVAYLRQKFFDKALENFDKAIGLNSKFDSAYHNRGMALSGKGRHEKAVEEFSKVIEINPSGAVLYKDRGTAYRKLGEYELAQKDFEKAIEIDKNFSPAYGALALLHAVAPNPPIRNPNQALKLAQKAVAMSGGNSPDMLENFAEVLYALGQPAAAASTLSKALAMDPNNREYRELLAKWQGSASPTMVRETEGQRKAFGNLW